MNRYALIGIVLIGFVVILSIAQAAAPAAPEGPAAQPGPGMRMGGMERPMMGPMMPMMAPGDVAASGGSIYLAIGPKLLKLDADLKVVASADLPMPEMPGMMMGGRMGMGGIRGGNPPAAGAPQDPPAPPAMEGPMPMGGQEMMGRMMAAGVRLDADEKGVYVLVAGKLNVYSTDLKLVKSADLRTVEEQAR